MLNSLCGTLRVHCSRIVVVDAKVCVHGAKRRKIGAAARFVAHFAHELPKCRVLALQPSIMFLVCDLHSVHNTF